MSVVADAELRAALEPLVVLDRLVVEPSRVEDKRIVTTYRVERGGHAETFDLVHRFEEPVFDLASPATRGLAQMIAVQPALNYGLFCREMVFEGPLDGADRRFIERFAAHTAREIFVNKILAPNPFLTGVVDELPPVRGASYLLARLVFPERTGSAGLHWHHRESPSARRAVVLSSGGKESLLSHAMLDEIGTEVHPIFVNESGRHWFTALNAFRALGASEPRTARVWTNADRLFTFMLRQLPFVRPDFQKVRADIYPIRLWTVAVFLFSVLPLALRRGAGRIVIGSEFDTTVRARRAGISHAAGLFDQSLPFDLAISRYLQRKGAAVEVFSILRPMSELLIEKILVERYPDVQALQTSCHACHVEGERVAPCGRCEKCRRVVGMLAALGADPGRCGYDADDVARILATLATRPTHQEEAGTQHTLHLLRERGLIDAEPAAVKPRPEILALRFDPERSPFHSLPQDLRSPLWRLALEHAEGALERRGRRFVDVDPLGDGPLGAPFPAEARALRARATASTRAGDEDAAYLLGEMTWPQARARLEVSDIALLPVGALEQHGPHLPLDTDAYDARVLADTVAQACSPPRPLVLPAIPYGVSYHHDDFPGTVSIGPDTLSRLVYEIGMSVARAGITKLILVNGHGGNAPALHFAAQLVNRDARIFTCVDTGETSDHDVDELTETPNDVHAGEVETSTTLHLRPHLVRMEHAEPCVPRFSSAYLDFTSKRSVGWYARTKRLSPSGVLGDPTKASPEKGARMWGLMVRNLVDFVEHLKGVSLDEIHERRY